MTGFERLYVLLLLFEHPLHQHVQRQLKLLAARFDPVTPLLDVGGRRSNYTIGVPARIWISDVPRETETQRTLDLGTTDEIREKVLKRRTNVETYVYDDLTKTQLPEFHFGIVSAIEVLEHVEDDEEFLRNVARVLRPGGFFVMTTPNGDHIPVPYPDHKRHYLGGSLETLLRKYFSHVMIEYRVNAGRLFSLGLHRPSARSPVRSLLGMIAFAACALLERIGIGGKGPSRKLHLFAVCRK